MKYTQDDKLTGLFTLLFESTHLTLGDIEGLDTCKRCYETQERVSMQNLILG